MITERQRVTQLIEGATVAVGRDVDPCVDLSLLSTEVGWLYNHEHPRPRSDCISSPLALELVDQYIAEVETWDALSAEVLDQRAHSLLSHAEQSPAWVAVRPLMTGYRAAFLRRADVERKRAAALVAARGPASSDLPPNQAPHRIDADQSGRGERATPVVSAPRVP